MVDFPPPTPPPNPSLCKPYILRSTRHRVFEARKSHSISQENAEYHFPSPLTRGCSSKGGGSSEDANMVLTDVRGVLQAWVHESGEGRAGTGKTCHILSIRYRPPPPLLLFRLDGWWLDL